MTLPNLPPIFKAMVNALGIVKTQDILLAYGGTVTNIDKLGLSAEELNTLRLALKNHLKDNPKSLKLDNRLSLPKIDKIFIHYRNYEIRQKRQYYSLNQLALMYHLTSRHIGNICRATKNDLQIDLFPE